MQNNDIYFIIVMLFFKTQVEILYKVYINGALTLSENKE